MRNSWLRHVIAVGLRGVCVWGLCVWGLCVAGGCTSHRATLPLEKVPADFTIDVAVVVGEKAPPSELVHLRPGRYVVYADGSFHSEVDSRAIARMDRLPAFSRTISQSAMQELLTLVNKVLLSSATDEPENLKLVTINPPDRAYLIAIRADQTWWTIKRLGVDDANTHDAQPEAKLIEYLGQLAWAPHMPPQKPTIGPRRYDLGPDPYQRYRRGEGG